MIIIAVFEGDKHVFITHGAESSSSRTIKLEDVLFEMQNEVVETTVPGDTNRTYETGPNVTITIKGRRQSWTP